ncbi:hypothetical protein [Sphingosinicella terrae]|uniref:hypothetical protein n=1 Tax=Sphingosinicella terrae TaxID=2172047 RepID=UPI000E0CF591|nr:hypothetical protein [Sphingosinicella terrae]
MTRFAADTFARLLLAATGALSLLSCGPAPAAQAAAEVGAGQNHASDAHPAMFPDETGRFDIVCETRGRMLGMPFDQSLRQPPPAGAVPSDHHFRLSVDLDAMENCGRWCETQPPDRIEAVGRHEIVFDGEHAYRRALRRSDGRFVYRVLHGKVVEEEIGRCTRAPFTAFPSRSLAPASPPPSGTLAALRRRVTALEEHAEAFFGRGSPRENGTMPDPEPSAPILAAARAEWDRRYAACRDDGCRRAILADRLSRLAFAFGHGPRRFPGLDLPGGNLHLETSDFFFGEITGSTIIYPIIDDRILASVMTHNYPSMRSVCQAISEGLPTPEGGLRMRAFSGDDDPRPRDWELRMQPGERVEMSSAHAWVGYCPQSVGLDGTFDILSVNDPSPEGASS